MIQVKLDEFLKYEMEMDNTSIILKKIPEYYYSEFRLYFENWEEYDLTLTLNAEILHYVISSLKLEWNPIGNNTFSCVCYYSHPSENNNIKTERFIKTFKKIS